jgi:hypothetical protein
MPSFLPQVSFPYRFYSLPLLLEFSPGLRGLVEMVGGGVFLLAGGGYRPRPLNQRSRGRGGLHQEMNLKILNLEQNSHLY